MAPLSGSLAGGLAAVPRPIHAAAGARAFARRDGDGHAEQPVRASRHRQQTARDQAPPEAPHRPRKYSRILLACSWLTSTSSSAKSPRSHSMITGVNFQLKSLLRASSSWPSSCSSRRTSPDGLLTLFPPPIIAKYVIFCGIRNLLSCSQVSLQRAEERESMM